MTIGIKVLFSFSILKSGLSTFGILQLFIKPFMPFNILSAFDMILNMLFTNSGLLGFILEDELTVSMPIVMLEIVSSHHVLYTQ